MPRVAPRPLPALVLALAAVGLLSPAAPRAAASEPAEVSAVRRLLKSEEPSARAAALRRLAGATGRTAGRLLTDALADPHPYVRRAAAGVIAASPSGEDPRARAQASRELRRLRRPIARAAACRVFALWADARGRAALQDALDDGAAEVRRSAIRWLGDPRVGFTEGSGEEARAVRRALEAHLQDPDGEVRALVLDAMAAWPEAPPPTPKLLDDPDPRVRFSALESTVAGASRSDRAYPGEDGGAAVYAVLRGLDDAVWSVRLLAAELSGRVPHRRLLPALAGVLSDDRPRVAAAAHKALVRLTRIPFDPDPAVWRAWLAGDGADFDPARSRRPGGPPGRSTDRSNAPARGSGRTVARPRFLGIPLISRHVGFVLDASASMRRRMTDGTSRWDQARRELGDAVRGLAAGPGGRSGVRVNVFVFQGGVDPVFKSAVQPSRGRRAQMDEALAAVKPGGKTALFDGLAAALADPDLDSLVLLSDGAPSAGAWFTKTDLLREVRRLNRWRRARIDVVQVGADGTAARWRTALRGLAEETGGRLVER